MRNPIRINLKSLDYLFRPGSFIMDAHRTIREGTWAAHAQTLAQDPNCGCVSRPSSGVGLYAAAGFSEALRVWGYSLMTSATAYKLGMMLS